MVKCPRCNQDVNEVFGNGEYPNRTWRCTKYHDNEITKLALYITATIIAVIGIIWFSR